MSSCPYPPGPRGSWLTGISPLNYGRPQDAVLNWAREYGDVVSWRTLHIRVYLLSHPDDIEQVLVAQNQSFIKGRGLQANRQLFGNGLLTSEGDFWLRQRRLMQPAFHRDRVASYGTTMMTHASSVIEEWGAGGVRDVHRDLMRLTLEIASDTLFGVSIGPRAEKVSVALKALQDANSATRRLVPLARRLPTKANRRYSWAVRQLDEVVYSIIAERRAQGVPGRDSAGDDHALIKDDLISRILGARDSDGSRMTDRQLRDECITLLLAGHETTALALSWTALLLAQNPQVQERLHAEVDAVLAGRNPDANDLHRLPYTEAVVRESLRLYPPAWIMPRVVIKDCEIHGYRIRKGASVLVSQWVVHHDPRYFRDPERFDPDRWTESFARSLPRFAYFPFGGGPRLCIGNNFALLESTLVLALIAQRFRLELADDTPVETLALITLRPKHGIRLTISRRNPSR